MRSAVVLVAMLVAGEAAAAPCEPAVELLGDDALVAALEPLLAARGIAGAAPNCPVTHARLTRGEGGAIVVQLDAPDGGPPIERSLDDEASVATVIESAVRADVASPLLEPHSLAIQHVGVHVPSPVPVALRGIHVFAVAESSFASDRTTWFGGQVGACVYLDPICWALRVRSGAVTGGPGRWDMDLERRGIELLFGIDIPFHPLGTGERGRRLTVSPGFGAGIGSMFTHVTNVAHAGNETGGLRADAHVTFSIAVSERLAIDVAVTGNLTQVTEVDQFSSTPMPGEPRALLRFGAGLRLGGL